MHMIFKTRAIAIRGQTSLFFETKDGENDSKVKVIFELINITFGPECFQSKYEPHRILRFFIFKT